MTDIWSFKYEPKKLKEMVLNDEIRPKLEKVIQEAPNTILYGAAGVGKGTFTKIFLKQTGYEYLWINASDKTGIDNIRENVKRFSYTATKNMKVVVFNEASALSRGASSAQEMLKEEMETTQKICRYFFLTNHINLITPEIQSRCITIMIDNPPIKEIALFASRILKAEKIKYDNKILIEIIKKCYPDIRRTIWAIQENSINGELKTSKIFTAEETFKNILDAAVKKDINEVRSILKSNYIEYPSLYEYLYENVDKFNSPGDGIIEIGTHLRWNSEMPNDSSKEINFMRMIVKMLRDRVIL